MGQWAIRGISERCVPKRMVQLSVVVAAAVVGGWWWLSSHGSRNTQPSAPPVPVTQATAASHDVPIYVQGLGTVQAYNTVNVRTRVDGQITAVSFKEGQEVKQGDPLFQVDPRPYQAALSQAQANKAKDEAQLRSAELDLERYAKLLVPGFQTRQSYDQQTATVGQLHAAVQADQAQIDNAQLNLDYATIRSPIDGRSGQRFVDLGNIVQAAQNAPLVSIAQLKPIFVSFTVPADSLDEIRENQAKVALTVLAFSSDDKTLLSEGQVTLVDNQVDIATNTIHLKGTFANADERLWPGQFVSAHLVLSTRKDAVTVPAQAIMQGPSGQYAYIIKPDQTADRRDVEVATIQDGTAIIGKGIAAGERVVVEGQYRLTKGAKLTIENPQQTAMGQQNGR
jgi:membrane fusion protein, multidrug efflux system